MKTKKKAKRSKSKKKKITLKLKGNVDDFFKMAFQHSLVAPPKSKMKK